MMLCILVSLFIIINIIIAVYDFTFFRIPNVLLLVLIGLFVVYASLEMDFREFLENGFLFLGALVVCYFLFAFHIIGGGDAKYIPVIVLWMGWHQALVFIVLMTVLGGGLAVAYLIFSSYLEMCAIKLFKLIQRGEEKYPVLKNIWVFSGAGALQDKEYKIKKIPYGVAISLSAIWLIINVYK